MSYMEQQMQSYIEGGLSEKDWCYTRIGELEAQVRQLQKQKDQLQLGFDDYKKMQNIADAEIRAQAIEDYAKKLPNSSRSVTIQSFRVALLTHAIKIRSETAE